MTLWSTAKLSKASSGSLISDLRSRLGSTARSPTRPLQGVAHATAPVDARLFDDELPRVCRQLVARHWRSALPAVTSRYAVLRSSRPIASLMAPDPASADRISDMCEPGRGVLEPGRAVRLLCEGESPAVSPVAIATRALRIWPRIRPAMSPQGCSVELITGRLGDSQDHPTEGPVRLESVGAAPSCREPAPCRRWRMRPRLRRRSPKVAHSLHASIAASLRASEEGNASASSR